MNPQYMQQAQYGNQPLGVYGQQQQQQQFSRSMVPPPVSTAGPAQQGKPPELNRNYLNQGNLPPMSGAAINSVGLPPPQVSRPTQSHMSPPGQPPMLIGQTPPLSGHGPPLSGQASAFGPAPPLGGQAPPLNGQPTPLNGQPPPPLGSHPPSPGQQTMTAPPPPHSVHSQQAPPVSGHLQPRSSQLPPPMQHQTNSITGQMQGMNLNGIQRPPPSQISKGGYPVGSYPAMNGGNDVVNGDAMPPPQQRFPPPQEMGGYQSNYSGQQSFPPGSFPPNQQTYPGQPGGYPTQQSSYPQPAYPGSQPGYPTGQPMFPGSQAAYPTTPAYQQQQQKKLDPDHMPSPMQVMQDDQATKSGVFYTNQKGQVPPLVTTDFIVQDQGNASPRFIRSTMYSVPVSADMMKQTSVPFGLVISPMADICDDEQAPPVVNMGELGPVRCNRCKAYMCPNMQFIDGGRRFHCLLCKATTDVSGEYFQHLDHTGMRMDRYERPELLLGAYEFLATKEYCRDNTFPQPPALIFIIDVSYNNVKSGLVSMICSQMKQFLQCLPREPGEDRSYMRVGFITYNKSVHFYNISPALGQPQMMIVGDVNDMFMPLLQGFLVDPIEAESVIDTLMQQIPALFADTKETETILAPAIQAGLEALKASGIAGKLLLFHSSLPIYDAPGKLKNRDDRKLLGTDKEKSVLTPQNAVYNNLGQDCVAAGCSVDLFIFNNSYIDIATIGQISKLTGGDIYKYTYFQADLDGDRVISDVERTVSRLSAFDAVMRIRTSAGVRPTDFYGHFFMSNATDIELACISPDKAVGVEIKHDDKLSEEEGVYIQVALLYTSISGQRKIRVLNLALKACSQMSDLYRTCELDTLINFFSKQALMRLNDSTPKTIKDGLIARSAQILACYRKNCATPTSASQLVLPECMKLLPLYINCLLKSDALSGGSDMTVDDRWFTMAVVTTMDIPTSVTYFYPRLVSLHDLDENIDAPPNSIRCSFEKMADDGAYLLENGIYMFIWLGLSLRSDWVMSVFGVPSAAQVDAERSYLPVLNNPLSEKIRNLIDSLNQTNPRSIRLTIVRQRDKMEVVMKHFLVEDRGVEKSTSYVDFLCHMHKEIRGLLTS